MRKWLRKQFYILPPTVEFKMLLIHSQLAQTNYDCVCVTQGILLWQSITKFCYDHYCIHCVILQTMYLVSQLEKELNSDQGTLNLTEPIKN